MMQYDTVVRHMIWMGEATWGEAPQEAYEQCLTGVGVTFGANRVGRGGATAEEVCAACGGRGHAAYSPQCPNGAHLQRQGGRDRLRTREGHGQQQQHETGLTPWTSPCGKHRRGSKYWAVLEGTVVCRQYNQGRCETVCPRSMAHRCSICTVKGHRASECTHNTKEFYP